MLLVASPHRVDLLINGDVSSSRLVIQSPVNIIIDAVYDEKESTLYWVTTEGLNQINSRGQSLIYKLNDIIPTALDLDKITGNIYVSGLKNETYGQERSIIRVVSKFLSAEVNIITDSQAIITDIDLDPRKGILFWSEHSKPYPGRLIRSTMDGRSSMWLHSLEKIVHPIAISLDTIKSRIYWADHLLHSISSCNYDGKDQKLVIGDMYAQPMSLAFFENHIRWTLKDQKIVYSRMINSNKIQHQTVQEKAIRIQIIHPILEPNITYPCKLAPCHYGTCVLENSTAFVCLCSNGVSVICFEPFQCEDKSSGIDGTLMIILISLAVLVILIVLGWFLNKKCFSHRSDQIARLRNPALVQLSIFKDF